MDKNKIRYILDRLKITGPINNNTPTCVIEEIAKCSNLDLGKCPLNRDNISSFINTISLTKSEVIYENPGFTNSSSIKHGFDDSDIATFQKLVLFVNRDQDPSWRKKTLLEAFRHLIIYYDNSAP